MAQQAAEPRPAGRAAALLALATGLVAAVAAADTVMLRAKG